MISKMVKRIKQPFQAYVDLTIVDPCRAISQVHKERQKNARPRKFTSSFSMRKHIQKQREMTSPETGESKVIDNVRDYYTQEISKTAVYRLH